MDLQQIITLVLVTIITGIISTIGTFATNFFRLKIKELKEKTKNEDIQKLLGMAEDVIATTVDSTTQTIVSELKKTNSFDKVAAKNVSNIVVNKICSKLKEEVKDCIVEISGMNLEDYVRDKVEAYIQRNKN